MEESSTIEAAKDNNLVMIPNGSATEAEGRTLGCDTNSLQPLIWWLIPINAPPLVNNLKRLATSELPRPWKWYIQSKTVTM